MPPRGPGKGKKPGGKKPKGKKPKGKKPKGRKPKKPRPRLGGAKLKLYMELRKRRRRRRVKEFHEETPLDRLFENATIRNSIVWHQPWGAIEPYHAWPPHRARQLGEWCDRILAAGNGEEAYAGLPEAPPLKVTPAGNELAQTALDSTDAWQYFLAHVAQSLVAESERWVPWSLLDYSSGELAMLLDSDSLFMWNAPLRAYVIIFGAHGRATPGDPFRTYAFLETNHLIGTDARSTIERVLDWCRSNLIHYQGGHDAANYLRIWQYAGYPPVERILAGTDQGGEYGFAHWTAGCWGTTAFLRALLRTVNVPVRLDIAANHAQPTFIREGRHLSHGDDPYNALVFATPPIPIGEILIDEATYQARFGPGVEYSEQRRNLARRLDELALIYLPNYLLRQHCADQQAGRDHAQSDVFETLSLTYTVEDLEAARLWERMDEKIASFGGCDHIPSGRG